MPAGYMTDIYTWAYVNPTNVRLLDNQLVVDGLLFFNARALERAVLPGAGHRTGPSADLTNPRHYLVFLFHDST